MEEFYKDTVTIFNRYEHDYTEKWFPTVLHGVRLLVNRGAKIAASGETNSDSASLHIRTETMEKQYLLPKEWKALEEKKDVFTLADGDFFVEGDVSSEDSSIDGFAEYMKQKYDQCFTVTTVDRYTLIPHLEVGGK